MQTINSRNRFCLFCGKIVLLLTFGLLSNFSNAQNGIMNLADHDDKIYYFGMAFGTNISNYRITYSDMFATSDSVYILQPLKKPGFTIGLLANLKIINHLDLRVLPAFVMSDRAIDYHIHNYQNGSSINTYSSEAILLHMPLLLRFKSDRIQNFRFYTVGGVKFDLDMNNNARSKKRNEILKVRPIDLGLEYGVGFQFYFSNFILSPELKFSKGLKNILKPDETSIISRSVSELNTNTVFLSLQIEG